MHGKCPLESGPGRANLLATLVLAWIACAARIAEASSAGGVPSPDLVWPQPPDLPRIAYVRSIEQPQDAGVKLSAFTRVANWVAGGDKGNERLLKPFGIAVDDEGSLCLTDTGANSVCVHDSARRKWSRWQKAGSVRFVAPVAVAKKGDRVFVADAGLGAVLVMDLKGKLVSQITNRLARPAGLAVSVGRLCVADSQRHVVVVFDLAGRWLADWGRRGTGPGEFNFPTHLAADRSGRLLVTDSMNGRVVVLGPDGRFERAIGSPGDAAGHFNRPKGVAADGAGRIYVIDGLADNFQIFDPTGQLLLAVGGSGTKPGQFWLPNGLAISRDQDIFVADSYNRRVQVFRYIGPP